MAGSAARSRWKFDANLRSIALLEEAANTCTSADEAVHANEALRPAARYAAISGAEIEERHVSLGNSEYEHLLHDALVVG